MGEQGIMKEASRRTRVPMRRRRVQRAVEKGTMILLGDKAKEGQVITLLKGALAGEIDCVLRYKRQYFMAAGLSSLSAMADFLQHAMGEQIHVNSLAERIVQLGGAPNLSPEESLKRNRPDYAKKESLREVLIEDLDAKRVAIHNYREMLISVGTDDPATCKILEGILAQELAHAADRKCLLKILGPESKSHRPIR